MRIPAGGSVSFGLITNGVIDLVNLVAYPGGGSGPENNPPVAVNDTAEVISGSSVVINVLTNDSDPDGDSLTLDSLTAPSHGVAVANGNSVNYTSSAGFIGTDTFEYTINDGNNHTDTANITVTINNSTNNIPPSITFNTPSNYTTIIQSILSPVDISVNVQDIDGTVESVTISVDGTNFNGSSAS